MVLNAKALTWIRIIHILVFETVILACLPFLIFMRKLNAKKICKKKKTIWTGAPIITIPIKCKSEQMLGFDSRSVVRLSYHIDSAFDYNLDHFASGNSYIAFCLTYLAFLRVCAETLHVHAFVDGGILPCRKNRQFNPLELWIYRILDIRLFVWTYGGDVRTRKKTLTMGEPNCCTECEQRGVSCICDERMAESNYDRVFKYATAVFSMGDMTEYTPGSINDLFFWPVDLHANDGQKYLPAFHDSNGAYRPLRIVHAPNHRQFKGTRHLLEAVDALRSDGFSIELVLVENVANDEALAIYRSADIVFDQCMTGFHGYFALEALALGKPVLCFIRDPQKYLLHPDECPIVNTSVATLKEDLRKMIAFPEQLSEIGKRGRKYIEDYYSLSAFASRLERAYKDLGVV